MSPNKIYALCDFELLQSHNLSLKQYLYHISKYNVAYVQYRDKININSVQKENILFLKDNINVPIIVNDKVELLEYADGLHLGQEDLEKNLQDLKINDKDLFFQLLDKKYPFKIYGLSTHNEKEILEANKLPLDYIGLGAYRNTSTKKDITSILGDDISKLAKLSTHPVGAIGGVKVDDDIENITYNVIGSGLLK
jgi:thiamine-phosphate pyrophosphorylase